MIIVYSILITLFNFTEDEHENTNQRGTNDDLDSLVTVEQLNRGTFVSSLNGTNILTYRSLLLMF